MFVFTAMAWTGWFYSCKRGGWGHDEAAQINWSRVGEMMGGWQLPVRWRCHRAMCGVDCRFAGCSGALTSMMNSIHHVGCGVLPACPSI
ncbi:Os02g0715250 [Oryza sativa Japonica Group]|uniref:Os02g0715250 protein n=1 Tax=Oryza sativa subsp. japonica TaxID=39947 RepID=A0A0P0VNR9_ORYSJ|nr:Os02g0715250 [Oryza sativa Japonica Group]